MAKYNYTTSLICPTGQRLTPMPRDEGNFFVCVLSDSPILVYLPTVTLTLALATARLTSLVRETLMQKTPESLKNWRRIIWQSGEGVASLQIVSSGVTQSASEMTVHTSLGKLQEE